MARKSVEDRRRGNPRRCESQLTAWRLRFGANPRRMRLGAGSRGVDGGAAVAGALASAGPVWVHARFVAEGADTICFERVNAATRDASAKAGAAADAVILNGEEVVIEK